MVPKYTEQIAGFGEAKLLALCGWRILKSPCFFNFPDLPEPSPALECVACFRRFEKTVLCLEKIEFCAIRSHFKHCYFAHDDAHPSVKEHAISVILSMQPRKLDKVPVTVDPSWLSKQREFLDHILVQR